LKKYPQRSDWHFFSKLGKAIAEGSGTKAIWRSLTQPSEKEMKRYEEAGRTDLTYGQAANAFLNDHRGEIEDAGYGKTPDLFYVEKLDTDLKKKETSGEDKTHFWIWRSKETPE